MHADIIQENNL